MKLYRVVIFHGVTEARVLVNAYNQEDAFNRALDEAGVSYELVEKAKITPIKRWIIRFGSSAKAFYTSYHAEQFATALRLNGTKFTMEEPQNA